MGPMLQDVDKITKCVLMKNREQQTTHNPLNYGSKIKTHLNNKGNNSERERKSNT